MGAARRFDRCLDLRRAGLVIAAQQMAMLMRRPALAQFADACRKIIRPCHDAKTLSALGRGWLPATIRRH